MRISAWISDVCSSDLLREQLAKRARGPGAMHGQARAAQRADAAEHEPPRLIETERAEHRLGVPGALPFRQNGPLQAVGERLGGEIEVRQGDLAATQADRKNVVEETGGLVRVMFGERRIIKKKKKQK